jgi:hypothetical protein
MRFMMIVRANEDTESGDFTGKKDAFEAMDRYNNELIRAGVLLGAEGLHPSAKGARIAFGNGKVTVTDGPFSETKELIAGFWILQVASREEAIEWARRVPFGEGGEVELRQIHEAHDFPEEIFSREAADKEQA